MVPVIHIALSRVEEVQVVLDLFTDLFERKDRCPGCCQLNSEGHPLHKPTNVSDTASIHLRILKFDICLLGALDKQAECTRIYWKHFTRVLRYWKARNGKNPLPH